MIRAQLDELGIPFSLGRGAVKALSSEIIAGKPCLVINYLFCSLPYRKICIEKLDMLGDERTQRRQITGRHSFQPSRLSEYLLSIGIEK